MSPRDSKSIVAGYGDSSDGGADPSTLITIPLDAQLLQKSAGYGDSTDGGADPSTLITIPLDAQFLQLQAAGYGDSTDGGSDPSTLITIPLDAQLLQKGTQPVKADLAKLQAGFQQKLHTEEAQLAKDESAIAADKQQLLKDEQQIASWKTLGKKEENEMQEMMKAEEYSAQHNMDKSTTGARLIACLKTRDVAQMEGEKIQKENAKMQSQLLEATNAKDMINQTLSSKIAEITTRASKSEAEQKANFDKLQKEEKEILSQFAKVKEENGKIMEVKRLIELEREQLQKQLTDLTNKHNKVVKAHEGLKKAHEVLKTRHDDLVSRAQTVNATQLSTDLHSLQGKYDKCLKNVTSMNSQEKKIHDTEADLRLAAFKQGTKEGETKWAAVVKNVTSERDAARYVAQESEKKVADFTATVDKETKAKEEAEVKLRQCRASREKMEVELERMTKRTGEKSSFLQLVPTDWA